MKKNGCGIDGRGQRGQRDQTQDDTHRMAEANRALLFR
jgi:hypothetical protein